MLLFILRIERKDHFYGCVVGVGKGSIDVFNLLAGHVVRYDKAVHDDSEVADLVGDITVAAGGVEYLACIVGATGKAFWQHVGGEGLCPTEICVRTVELL